MTVIVFRYLFRETLKTQLAVLFVVHRFGRRLFRLIIPHEARLTRIYRMLGRK